MKRDGYYSSGDFARKARITLRTVRYYDKQNILKPTYVSDSGARFYTDDDFARLQQILLLKYLGFSLEDIREMTITEVDSHFMLDSLNIQNKLIQDRIDQMQLVQQAIANTIDRLETDEDIDWSESLNLVHLTNEEKSLKNQYQNASNISARIHLHKLYSTNNQGWFPWLFERYQLTSDMSVLELGCGDGALWTSNTVLIPSDITITLSDISSGMLNDAKRAIGACDQRFSYYPLDCHHLPFANDSFDLIIANHVLFYCDDIAQVCREVQRVLKPGGRFLCSTYGNSHMQEITQLVKRYDEQINLSSQTLYHRFGKENGQEILMNYFPNVAWSAYQDELIVTEPEPLVAYVLSCHGNQSQHLLSRYKDFLVYVTSKTDNGFHITKDAGVFICTKEE